MKYEDMRARCKSGDKITVSGGSVFSGLVRLAMQDSESHVAVLCWDKSRTELMIVEKVEKTGYNTDHASIWFARRRRKGQELTYNAAPEQVTRDQDAVESWLKDQRRALQPYGWRSLVLVWAIRMFNDFEIFRKVAFEWLNIDYENILSVCSIFAQRLDQSQGYERFPRPLVGPGFFRRYPDGGGSWIIEPEEGDKCKPENSR